MSNVEQLLSLCELAGTVSMSRREWEMRFPAQWQHLQLVLDSCDDRSEVVPRVDDPTQMLDVVLLPDDTLVACDRDTRGIVERVSHTACEMWQVNAEKLIRLVCSLIDGAEVKGPATSSLWNFGRWPSKRGHTLPLYLALPSHRCELVCMLRDRAAQGGKTTAAIFTWTDRFWSPDVQQTAQSAGLVVVPIMEVLELGVTGWCLSPTWPTFESVLRERLSACQSRGTKPNRTIGRMYERRVAVEQIERALRDMAYERIRKYEQATQSEREALRQQRVQWLDVAGRAKLTPSRVSNAQQSEAGKRARGLFELVNDPDKLFSRDPETIRMLSCISLVEPKSKSIRIASASVETAKR